MATKKKSPAKKKTRSSQTGGQKRTAQAKPAPKKKPIAKKKSSPRNKSVTKSDSALRKETPRRVEAARSLLNEFGEKKRVKSLFALETKEDLKEKTVAELRAIAREAGITLKARRKAEMAREIAGGLDLFQKVRKKPSAKVRKPSPPGRKKPAPAKKRIIRPARTILKARPSAKVKKEEAEAAFPEAPGVLLQEEATEPLVEKALGDVLKEEAGEAEHGEISSRKAYALEKPARAKPLERPRDVDRVTAVAVDSHTMFVDWDMTEETARRGEPALRVYEVTGIEFDGRNYLAFDDLELAARGGESFIEAKPEREYIVDAGVKDGRGRFRPARRTSKVTIPPEAPPEGPSALPEEYFRFRPGGYGHR